MPRQSNKQIQRNRMLRYFVRATQEQLALEGLEGVNLRKIAKRAGYNSATLYNYFEDLEDLLLLASVPYLDPFAHFLEKLSTQTFSYEMAMRVLEYFCDITFAQPQIFSNFFFGKHSKHMGDTVAQYYRLFPEEWVDCCNEVEQMAQSDTLEEGLRKLNLWYIQTNQKEINEEKQRMLLQIEFCNYHAALCQLSDNPKADAQALKKRFMLQEHYLWDDAFASKKYP